MTAAAPLPAGPCAHDLERLAGAIEFVGYPNIAGHLRSVAKRLVDYDNPELLVAEFRRTGAMSSSGRCIGEFLIEDMPLSQMRPGERFALVRLPEVTG